MSLLKKPKSSELCSPGYHIVHGYERVCHSGTVTWVHLHRRRNRGKFADLRKENLLYLYWNNKKKYGKLNKIAGFKKDDGELDGVIQFWLNYWQEQGLKISEMDPLLVKALIAIESNFNPKALSKVKGSSAYGLMQLTNQARRVMSGHPDQKGYREITSDLVAVSRDDVSDSVVNIAAGIRWLAYKYSKIPKGQARSTFNTIKNYHSWDKAGETYAQKVRELYEKSK